MLFQCTEVIKLQGVVNGLKHDKAVLQKKVDESGKLPSFACVEIDRLKAENNKLKINLAVAATRLQGGEMMLTMATAGRMTSNFPSTPATSGSGSSGGPDNTPQETALPSWHSFFQIPDVESLLK